jgi:hypothetical protein
MKADLAPHPVEICAGQVVAVGECTGSDPSNSEAKLLRDRLESMVDLGRQIFPDQQDPA